MSRVVVGLSLLLLVLSVLAGCRQEMAQQPSVRALEPSSFWPDRQSARHPPPGTVARSEVRMDRQLFTGILDESKGGAGDPKGARPLAGEKANRLRDAWEVVPYVDAFPYPVTQEVLHRGQQRYNIFCSVCHDPLGGGLGVVVERGYTKPPSYHTPRLREAPVGYFYDVITRGYGSMPNYGDLVPSNDRWAIAAYIRALQLSQNAELSELPEPVREEARKHLEERRGEP